MHKDNRAFSSCSSKKPPFVLVALLTMLANIALIFRKPMKSVRNTFYLSGICLAKGYFISTSMLQGKAKLRSLRSLRLL